MISSREGPETERPGEFSALPVMRRRRFLLALAASVVAAGASLPVGFPRELKRSRLVATFKVVFASPEEEEHALRTAPWLFTGEGRGERPMISPYDDGGRDQRRGRPRDACPYESGTEDAQLWLAGWDEAADVDEIPDVDPD